jgi:hypothetical protein
MVLRFLAEDVGKYLAQVLNAILRPLSHQDAKISTNYKSFRYRRTLLCQRPEPLTTPKTSLPFLRLKSSLRRCLSDRLFRIVLYCV